jgi:hypothetical protein
MVTGTRPTRGLSRTSTLLACLLVASAVGCSKSTPKKDDSPLTSNDGGGNGGPDSGPGSTPGTDPSGAPLGLVATAVGTNEISLCWRPVSDSGTSYNIYRDGTVVASTSDVCFADKTVSPGTTYSYAVTAGRGGSESPRSATAAATTFRPDSNGDVVAGSFRSSVTMQSIGMEWDVSGDANHNATAEVSFHAVGSPLWRKAMAMIRVDTSGKDMVAGSVLFLAPGTEYEVVANLTDPDGGSQTKRFNVKTREMPTLPTSGRTLHVAPGSGGGDGTAGNPFRGVAAAAAESRPGDVMLLHGGNYGGRISFTAGGEQGNLIAWKAAGDGDPVFAGIEVRASHLWLEGLRVEAGGGYDFPIGLRTANAPTNVSVVRCTFVGNHYSIWLNGGGSNWYIADNDITGDNTVTSGSFSGEGVEMEHTAGHTVAHNRIKLTGDGMSYCSANCDIYGNDIFDTSDDGIEPDGGAANIRIWGNRMRNTGHNGISMQPMAGAPWYFIRNLIIGNSENMLKTQGSDRFVAIHNTFVNWSNMQPIWGYEMLNGTLRNNIWVSVNGGSIFSMGSNAPSWKTNLDYDGFDWGSSSSPFKVQGSTFGNVSTFSAASGQERHGVQLKRSCFPTLNVKAGPPASVPEQVVTLSSDCAAIDAGEVLPNINEDYLGAAPDLGAFEFGASTPNYGPR